MKLTDALVISTLLLPLTLAACDKNEDEESTSETSASETSTSETSTSDETGNSTSDPPADETTTGGTLSWYSTCGDPVCMGYGGPFEGVAACGEIVEGDPCTTEGETCDFMSDCNALLICATEDPKMQEGGCPISRAKFKQDIAYLDPSERDAFYEQLLAMRMATWRYRARGDAKTHLGVILEDGEDEVWADPANDRVDLYSYGSLAIVGVQKQAAEITELEAAVAALQVQVEALREQAERCK